MNESCQECKGWGRTREEEVRGSDAKEERLEKQIFDLKQELRKKNEAADELKHRIGGLKEKLKAADEAC